MLRNKIEMGSTLRGRLLLWIHVIAAILIAPALLPANDLSGEAENKPQSLWEIEPDLVVPEIETGESLAIPGAGRRVRHQLEPGSWSQTEVYHTLYLPVNWQPGKKYPVLVEFPGNGPYKNKLGDVCTGFVDDCRLGYGISAGRDFIWICLPFVSEDRHHNQRQWWGNPKATVEYCREAVSMVCRDWGGDESNILLCGFSRGAIACSYIGLRDEKIARLWKGFICHSHFDGVRKWPYPDSDPESALKRLKLLNNRPVFISHELDTTATREFLTDNHVEGNFQFLPLPYPNHTDAWVLRDIPERSKLRLWLHQVIHKN